MYHALSPLLIRCAGVAAVLFSFANPSYSESTTYGGFYFTQKTPKTLYLLGEIRDSDDFDLRRALRDHDIQTLALISKGGSVSGGLALAGIVGDRKLRTVVPTNALCASACSYIFLAGNERKASGFLGVHQFASVEGDRSENVSRVQSETQALTAEILGFLRDFQTPAFVAEYMFRSLEMHWFNEAQIEQLNSVEFTLEPTKLQAIDDVVEGLMSEINPINRDESSSPNQPDVKVETPRTQEENITEKEYISIVQKRLNELNCEAGAADGVLGRNTIYALKRFSKRSGMSYYDGIIFDEEFGKKLLASPDMTCAEVTRKKTAPVVSPMPLKLATHWKISCSNSEGTVLFTVFARIITYNNKNGNISIIVKDSAGAERSMHGSISKQRLNLYDQTGYFNSNYTRFSLSDPDCPTKLSASALY